MESMIRAVGVDLDGTLLQLSNDFIPEYLRLVNDWVAPRLNLDSLLSKAIWETTMWATAKDHGDILFQDAFYRNLCQTLGVPRQTVEEVFATFYRTVFRDLRYLAHPVVGAMGFLTQLQAMGLRVALLTSPVFPKMAIEERLVWAGLEGFPFDWISSFEVVHAAKPHPAYYGEAAKILGIEPPHWLMVGNDLDADIRPAVATGMQAWWVNSQELPDDLQGKAFHGTFHRLLEMLKTRCIL